MDGYVTPRKRKAGGEARGAGSARKGAPAPNPPVMPFPTPPRTNRRLQPFDVDSFLDLSQSSSTDLHDTSTAKQASLPPHLQTLLTLHRAFNVALSLHIATHPPVLPPHAPSATSVKLPNLTNLLALRETIERTGGRRFGVAELQRLAWVWTWDGSDPDAKRVQATDDSGRDVDGSGLQEDGIKGKGQGGGGKDEGEDDNPFLVKTSPDQCPTLEISGLDYLITPTRTLDPTSSRRVYTYGIGIELQLRVGETRQLLHGGSEGGIGNKGQGGGMGAVGRWNVAGEEREEVVRERLERWVEMHGGHEEPDTAVSTNGLATPPATRDRPLPRSAIPPIPLLPLPHLPSSTLLPSANLFGASPSPAKLGAGLTGFTPFSTPVKSGGLSDPFVLSDPPSTPSRSDASEIPGSAGGSAGKSTGKGSVEFRRQAMMDRIKARKSQKNGLPTLGASIADPNSPRMGMGLNKADTQEELKRRSTLSRLEGVAEAVWMMFSAPAQSTTSVTLTPPRGRRKAVPMVEAAEVIVKSSKTPISIAEAQASLTLLTELCPFFLQLKLIGRSEWLEMPPQVSAVPQSPGSSMLGTAASILPRHPHLPAPPVSPRGRVVSGPGSVAGPGSCVNTTLGPPRTPTTPNRLGATVSTEPDASSIILTPGRGAGTYAHVSDSHPYVSPSTSISTSTRLTPRRGVPTPSPGRAARMAAMELSGVSPGSANAMAALRGDDLCSMVGLGGAGGTGGAIAGPASPGRVRRVGGLREVRERIRRELGE